MHESTFPAHDCPTLPDFLRRLRASAAQALATREAGALIEFIDRALTGPSHPLVRAVELASDRLCAAEKVAIRDAIRALVPPARLALATGEATVPDDFITVED